MPVIKDTRPIEKISAPQEVNDIRKLRDIFCELPLVKVTIGDMMLAEIQLIPRPVVISPIPVPKSVLYLT